MIAAAAEGKSNNCRVVRHNEVLASNTPGQEIEDSHNAELGLDVPADDYVGDDEKNKIGSQGLGNGCSRDRGGKHAQRKQKKQVSLWANSCLYLTALLPLHIALASSLVAVLCARHHVPMKANETVWSKLIRILHSQTICSAL